MKTHFLKRFIFFALILISQSVISQEYLVTVNPATGVYTKTLGIASTHSVQIYPGHTTIDKTQNRYFFKGIDWAGVEKLYIINANTSATNREIAFPSANTSFNQIGNLQFDDSTGNIYCTGLHLASNRVYILKMDTLTAAVSTVVLVPDIGNAEGNQSTYDQQKHRYMFIGTDPSSAGGTSRYLNIDVMTGMVIANVPNGIGAFPTSLRWNNVTKKLYAFANPIPMSFVFKLLVEFDPLTAARIATIASSPTVGTIPLVWKSALWPNHTTIDEINNRYTISLFLGADNNGVLTYSLYTISLSTGSVLYNPFLPQGLNIMGENLVEFHYNNNNGLLYGLHWKFTNNPIGIIEQNKDKNILIFPNPCGGSISMNIREGYGRCKVRLINTSGDALRLFAFYDNEKINLDVSGISAGLYIAEIDVDGKTVIEKIVRVD